MKILHVVPGLGDPANGIAAAATRLAEEQRALGDEVSVSPSCTVDDCRVSDVVIVHSMWTPPVLRACHAALRAGTPLVRVPHGCLNPAALRHSAWKKALGSPLERTWAVDDAPYAIAVMHDFGLRTICVGPRTSPYADIDVKTFPELL